MDDTALEDAAAYLDVLEDAEEAGAIADCAAFEARVAALWALPDVHAGATDVQIMTIHKAKGLEFDHVIVPGLGRPPRAEEPRLFLWTEREGGWRRRAAGRADRGDRRGWRSALRAARSRSTPSAKTTKRRACCT